MGASGLNKLAKPSRERNRQRSQEPFKFPLGRRWGTYSFRPSRLEITITPTTTKATLRPIQTASGVEPDS